MQKAAGSCNTARGSVCCCREELQQPVFSAIDVLEFPELHEESIGQLAFNRAVTKLLLFAGVHDFTLQDLYKPEYNRTIRNLSAIINFAKFRYAVYCLVLVNGTTIVLHDRIATAGGNEAIRSLPCRCMPNPTMTSTSA